MAIQGIRNNFIDSLFQIGTAIVITMLQRWLLELSTPQKDWKWFQSTRLYRAFLSSHWYRGIEAYYQYEAWRILARGDVS